MRSVEEEKKKRSLPSHPFSSWFVSRNRRKFATMASEARKDNDIHPYAIINRLVTHRDHHHPRSWIDFVLSPQDLVDLGKWRLWFPMGGFCRSQNRENVSPLRSSRNLAQFLAAPPWTRSPSNSFSKSYLQRFSFRSSFGKMRTNKVFVLLLSVGKE